MPIDLEQVEKVCQLHGRRGASFFTEDFSEGHIRNAHASLGVPENERIYALIDFTSGGSGREGIAVSESGIYWRSAKCRYNRMVWADLEGRQFIEHHPIRRKWIILEDGDLSIQVTAGGAIGSKHDKTIFEFMSDLARVANGEIVVPVIEQSYSAAANGFLACEYCGGLIKPEVTFCKHCGIKLRG